MSEFHLPADESLFTPFSLVDLHLEDLPELLVGISILSLWKNLLSTHFPCLALVPDGPGSSGMLLSLTRVSSSNSELLELLRSIVGRKGHYYNFMYICFFYCLLSGIGQMYIYILCTIDINK